MPQGPMSSPLMKPFVVLALPGMYLFYKYNQYKRKRKENARRKLTERELQHLHSKIDKLLDKLEESEPELATSQEEECVICINAKATMQTAPCGHQVVCRKCFVKTIQIAVSQRLLPLRCVICRAKILRLKSVPAMPTSVSAYSVNSRSSINSTSSSVPQSDSLYSVSSGGSSVSSTSCSSAGSRSAHHNNNNNNCCGGCAAGGGEMGERKCVGAYPRRQPATGLIRRSQQHAMKMRLQEYCHPSEKTSVNRLPPIREMPGCSPNHGTPPPSTRIRCAQKIVTQLESVPLFMGNGRNKYKKLPQDDFNDDDNDENRENNINHTNIKEKTLVKNHRQQPSPSGSVSKSKKWWTMSNKSLNDAEKIDNKKNEMAEMEMKTGGGAICDRKENNGGGGSCRRYKRVSICEGTL